MNLENFWQAVLSQDETTLPKYFSDDAIIRWPCTNEQFNVAEYIRANCEYPGTWSGEIERIEKTNDSIVSAVRVFPADEDRVASFYVVSFMKLKDDVIVEMDEYWARNGKAPKWRQKMGIGKSIR